MFNYGCEYCHSIPHIPGCPQCENTKVHDCAWCDEPIYAGENCYKLLDDYYHEDCLDDNAVDILLEKTELCYITAGEDE